MAGNATLEWTTTHWVLLAALAVFGAAVLQPVLSFVNEPGLVAGFPVLYVWAIVWGVVGTVLLYLITRDGYFGIDEDQVPPELAEDVTVPRTDETAEPTTPAPAGED